jgi:hypothetical protein
MPVQITDEAVIVAGDSLQPTAFPGLVEYHLKDIRLDTIELEASARRLIATGFLVSDLEQFISHVCGWGGYAGIAGRIHKHNPPQEVRYRFINAMDALDSDRPDVLSALCELRQIRQLGLSFASKHLRFLRPDLCPAFDTTLSQWLDYTLDVCGYKYFSDDCLRIAKVLQRYEVSNPVQGRDTGKWFAADVEMALFSHVRKSKAPA